MGPHVRFCLIADDLTGALDSAAPFAANGWRTQVVPWPGGTAARAARALAARVAAAAARADVVVVETASRHVAPREAGRRVRAAVGAAAASPRRAPGPFAFFKKIDSTLRGNVAVELAAFRAATGAARLPCAPAFPAQGRVTRGGAVWVDGRPLAASAAARDARAPASPGGLLAALDDSGALEVLDAETDADLRRIARRLTRERRLGAVVGSGGLAGALAATLGPGARSSDRRRPANAGGMLVVSGSAHPAAQVQARALAAQGTLVLVAPPGARDQSATAAVAAEALRAGRPVALLAPPLAPGARVSPRSARLTAARLARLARRLVTIAPIGTLMTVGGDTTAAIVAAMAWAPLTVAGTVAPGIALVSLTPPGGAGPRWLVTKSGAFGDPQTLRRLVRRLTTSARRPRRHGSASTPR